MTDLRFTHGQVVHAIWWTRWHWPFDEGPTKEFMARLNYLRSHGVPFPPEAAAPGSGRSLIYGFDELAELALAIELTDRRAAPGDVAKLLVDHREELRAKYREAYWRRDEKWNLSEEEFGEAQGLIIEITLRYTGDVLTVSRLDLMTPPDVIRRVFAMRHAVCSGLFVNISALIDRVIREALEAPVVKRGRRKGTPAAS
jgi:hypothetical protein